MWRQLFTYTRQLFDLVNEVNRLRNDLIDVQTELKDVRAENAQSVQSIRDLAHGLVHLKETQLLERENLMLRIELELTKLDKKLPPAKENRD